MEAEKRKMKMKSLLMEVRKRHKKIERLMTEAHKKTESTSQKKKADLPLSLIESNILPRLPAKSVGRCMCVCKQWKSFLSTPTFARMHLAHVTIHDHKLLLLDRATFSTLDCNHAGLTLTIRPNPNPNPNPSVEFILASLNGLVCLGSRDLTTLAFWNPLTGAYKKLSSMSRPATAGVGFDTLSDAIIGFYIDSSGDYKLVYLSIPPRPRAYIYSLTLDSWREIDFSVGSNISRLSMPTFYGQCLYFNAEYIRAEGHRWIICFDVEKETFWRKPYPPAPGGSSNYYGTLVVLNGCLQLYVSYTYIARYHVGLQHKRWKLDAGDGWVKVACTKGPLYKTDEFISTKGQCICTTSTAGNSLAVLKENNVFIKMNTEEFTSNLQWQFCFPDDKYTTSRMIYVETLVSPNL